MAPRMVIEAFPYLLDPTFRQITDGAYKEEEDFVPKLYSMETPTLPTEKGASLTGMGLWSEFTGLITYDAPVQGYKWSTTYKEFAKGTQVERSLIEYDQFKLINSRFKLLGVSARNTRQIEAAQTFQQAFIVDSGYTHEEGVALCSSSHTSPVSTTDTTVGFDNYTTAALSPVSLKAIFIQMRKFKQDNGQPVDASGATMVLGPIDLQDRAEEIFRTTSGLDSADGNVNVLKDRYTYKPWIRLTDVNNYFVIDESQMKENLLWFDKVKPEFSRMEDFDGIVAKYRGYAIWHRARADWRWVVGANVS
jgi:hypothetical protein